MAEVDRKLALVESLAERISREKPEDVAGPLLRLHGYQVTSHDATTRSYLLNESKMTDDDDHYNNNDDKEHYYDPSSSTTTLQTTRERCTRLKRQSQVLESVSQRVEQTLLRGLARMESATSKLERVLHTGQVLKMTMRLVFEAKKISKSGLLLEDFEALCHSKKTSQTHSLSFRGFERFERFDESYGECGCHGRLASSVGYYFDGW